MANQKLKACIAYICQKERPQQSALDPVKLNKVLWYSDASSYMDTRTSITGSKYIRKPRGPVAKGMMAAIGELERSNVITIGRRYDESAGAWLETYDFTGRDEVVPEDIEDDEPPVELTVEEKERLDSAHKKVCLESDTDSISERTHGEIWDLASDGEEIPLFAAYAERLGVITKEHVLAASAA